MDPVNKRIGKVVTIARKGMPPIELGITSEEEIEKIAAMSPSARNSYLKKILSELSDDSIKSAGFCLHLEKKVELMECLKCARTNKKLLKLNEWDSCKATNLKNP